MNQLSLEEYNELCPYERQWDYWDFNLEVPLVIQPHKQTYQIGDTMNFKMELPDDIYDMNRQRTFKIENFPFKPSFELYRVDTSGWTTGYVGNEVIIDSTYDPYFSGETSAWSKGLRGRVKYDDGGYIFEWQLVLKEPGRYVHMVRDGTENVNLTIEVPPDYADIKNDSGCPEPHDYRVSYILQGDSHFEEFQEELQYVDKNVKSDKMCSFYDSPPDIWGNGLCRIRVEFTGVFGFEVVE